MGIRCRVSGIGYRVSGIRIILGPGLIFIETLHTAKIKIKLQLDTVHQSGSIAGCRPLHRVLLPLKMNQGAFFIVKNFNPII